MNIDSCKPTEPALTAGTISPGISALSLATHFSWRTPSWVAQPSCHSLATGHSCLAPAQPPPRRWKTPVISHGPCRQALPAPPPSKAGTVTQPSPGLALICVGTPSRKQLQTSADHGLALESRLWVLSHSGGWGGGCSLGALQAKSILSLSA